MSEQKCKFVKSKMLLTYIYWKSIVLLLTQNMIHSKKSNYSFQSSIGIINFTLSNIVTCQYNSEFDQASTYLEKHGWHLEMPGARRSVLGNVGL